MGSMHFLKEFNFASLSYVHQKRKMPSLDYDLLKGCTDRKPTSSVFFKSLHSTLTGTLVSVSAFSTPFSLNVLNSFARCSVQSLDPLTCFTPTFSTAFSTISTIKLIFLDLKNIPFCALPFHLF